VIVRISLLSIVMSLMAWDVHAMVGVLDTEYLKKGVVRITAKSSGESPKVGTGFIVQLDQDVVYVVTAAHVVSGDAHPKVQFFPQQDLQVPATVKHSEGGEDTTGLALLVIRGKEVIPQGLTVVTFADPSILSGNDAILVVGHPRNAGDWVILNGSVVGRQGRYVTIDANIDEGTSGAPIIHSSGIVGIVGEVKRYGRGVTSGSIQEYLKGHGLLKGPALSSTSTAGTVPSPRAQENTSSIVREIIGKDGAPMVLIPSGEFWMGSLDDEGEPDEHPQHQIYVDAFYIDNFEITVERYAKFLGETKRSTPEFWGQVDARKHNNHPVVGVHWNDAGSYCAGQANVCRQRPNGRRLLVAQISEHIHGGMTGQNQISPISIRAPQRGRRSMNGGLNQWEAMREAKVHTEFMISPAMFGSGCRIGLMKIITREVRLGIRPGRGVEPEEWFAGVRGFITRNMCVPPTGRGFHR